MYRGSTFWGLALLLVGVVLLLTNFGILAINAWNLLWPLFLVLLGVWLVLGAFTRGHGRAPAGEQASIPLEGTKQATIKIRHGAGHLALSSGAAPDKLLEGTFAGGLEYRAKRDGESLRVKMRVAEREFWGPWSWGPNGLDWNFQLNGAIPLALELETGAGENRLDLTNLAVSDLRMRTGASSSHILLPANAGQTHADISVGAASVALRVPPAVAARVHVRGVLAGVTVDTARFPRAGDSYESPDYASSSNKVEIDVDLGVGSVDVR